MVDWRARNLKAAGERTGGHLALSVGARAEVRGSSWSDEQGEVKSSSGWQPSAIWALVSRRRAADQMRMSDGLFVLVVTVLVTVALIVALLMAPNFFQG